jgi:nickel-dependent lactate racemase
MVTGTGYTDGLLSESEARDVMSRGLEQANLSGKRVLIIIPDSTRSGPVPLFFRLFHELLWGEVAALDYLIALGTHTPMKEEAIHRLLGVTAADMAETYAGVRVFNHQWEKPETFRQLGVIPAAEIEELSNGLFSQELPVTLNKMIFDYDQVIVCGPVFPHEAAGYSGGNKYFFPGISGPEVIHFTHWMSAVITGLEIIGQKDNPVRSVIDRAADFIDVPKLFCCYVVKGHDLVGVYVGEPRETWPAAVDLSSRVNVVWVPKPYDQVLSVMPEMYKDLWTAGKGMYRLEPVVADGGEITIYAPHVDEISYTHGHVVEEIGGYHVRDYFLEHWDRFKHYPWGILAFCTHLIGSGTYENGEEHPRIKVSLATGISKDHCERLGLNYRDPDTIHPEEWAGREDEGILLVPRAGEVLYMVEPTKDAEAKE